MSPITIGIRAKLSIFILALSCALIAAVAAVISSITEDAVRKDLVQRGVAVSRIVALSAGYSLLSGDTLALHRLTSETKAGASDIEHVAVLDKDGTILSHDRIDARGARLDHAHPAPGMDEKHGDTTVEEISRDGREMIEFTTPLVFAGKPVGTVSLALSKASLVRAQRDVRRSILAAAAVFLLVALAGALILSSIVTTPVKKLSSGVSELAGGSFNPIPSAGGDELGELTRNFNRMAETILTQQGSLSRYAQRLEESYVSLVRVIAASLDARDPYTLGHSTRVARLACEVGKRIGFSEEETGHLEKACLFHDIGKIRTPDDILLKPQPLSAEQLAEMRRHPFDGAEILRVAPTLHRYIPVVMSHHEWYNGNGYPEGRRAQEIPVHAQIIALADAYDAMTSTRPYRDARTPAMAIAEIIRCRGTQFSPELTDIFVRAVAETEPGAEIPKETVQ